MELGLTKCRYILYNTRSETTTPQGKSNMEIIIIIAKIVVYVAVIKAAVEAGVA